jgi:hypothetical protein
MCIIHVYIYMYIHMYIYGKRHAACVHSAYYVNTRIYTHMHVYLQ